MKLLKDNPILGIIVLLIISISVLILTDVNLGNLSSIDGLESEFKTKGLILIVVLGIFVYGLYHILSDEKNIRENFMTTNTRNIIKPSDNRLYVLRTKINGDIYYLVNDELDEENLPNFFYRSRERPNTFIGEMKSTVCRRSANTFVQPMLVREDILMRDYNSYLTLPQYLENRNDRFSNDDTVPDVRYTHHWNMNTHPLDANSYLVSGYTNQQLIGEYGLTKYVLTGKQSLDPSYVHSGDINGLNFACMSQDPQFTEMSRFGLELDTDADNLDIDENTKKIVGVEDHEKIEGMGSLFMEVDGNKFYLAMLDEFRHPSNMKNTDHSSHMPLDRVPIGFIPEDIMKNDVYNSNPKTNIQNEYNFAKKIEFDIIAINL